ncbi:MAG: methyltransferase domain-containing protein [Lachnospiraceae bacterium]
MKKEGYFSSGEFAKMANITKKTLRYYDEKNIFKPSFVSKSGARFYSNEDFGRIQQILLLKYLGFSLKDIKEMVVEGKEYHQWDKFLEIQYKLVEDRIEQLRLVSDSILDALEKLKKRQDIDCSQMLNIIHLTRTEASLKNQYRNASNISARIQLHTRFSKNKKGWFTWIYERLNLRDGMNILEVGCGDGALWKGLNIPEKISLTLTDISEGMIRDVRKVFGEDRKYLRLLSCDCQAVPFEDNTFDLVVANHVLFYCGDVEKACREIYRVLKPGGRVIAATYGKHHMEEINRLVLGFDERIVLSSQCLYERFGKENGGSILEKMFKEVCWEEYEDSLCVNEPEPLISYILSCHGNQNEYIIDCYNEFKDYVKKKMQPFFYITKEAGIFSGKK